MRQKVQVTETLQRVVEVEATSSEEACRLVERMYRIEEVVLDRGDLVNVEINAQASQVSAHPILVFDTLRGRLIQSLYDYVSAQPGKRVDLKESIIESIQVIDGEAIPVTYNSISASADKNGRYLLVNFTDDRDGETYGEQVEDLSVNEIYDIISLL